MFPVPIWWFRAPGTSRIQPLQSCPRAFLTSVMPVSRLNEDAGVAQLARASAFQAEGRGFESRFPLHFLSLCFT